MRTLVVAAMLVALALAGCTAENSPGGQSASGNGSLAYNGSSSGTQRSDGFSCDGSAQVSLAGNLGSGSLTVKVTDGAGSQVYSKSANGPGQVTENRDISGAAGDWRITATRGAGFTGQYTIGVDC